MTDVNDRLLHARVVNDIRARIASGDLAVEKRIPSTAQLVEEYGVSISVVRRAVDTLKNEGLLQGQPGKGVYVIATPEQVAAERRSLESLASEVADLRTDLQALTKRLDSDSHARTVATEVAELRSAVEQLYARLGYAYPTSDAGTPKRRHRNTGT
ncbi:GntR family transcriptional regulator [Nonomuraea polychroma]|uniref:winged helix-turn-helix domain-containing protein n=1 Tax=Nonomuraea polychroma TaxID=46176 RepID=UPI003D91D4E1